MSAGDATARGDSRGETQADAQTAGMRPRAAIRALTVWQPWAYWIACGLKRVENRTWPPPRSLVGGYLAIHAGARRDREIAADAVDFLLDLRARGLAPPRPSPLVQVYYEGLPFGAVVAVARLTGWVTASADGWFTGPVGWELADAVALPTPVPCKGARGAWELSPAVLAAVRAQWKAARDG